MKVSMLIELLNTYDPQADVMVEVPTDDGWRALLLRAVTTNKDKPMLVYDTLSEAEEIE